MDNSKLDLQNLVETNNSLHFQKQEQSAQQQVPPLPKYYAIRHGKYVENCIFLSWKDAKHHVSNYDRAEFAMFQVIQDALQYLEKSLKIPAGKDANPSSSKATIAVDSGTRNAEVMPDTSEAVDTPSYSTSSPSQRNDDQDQGPPRKKKCLDTAKGCSSDGSAASIALIMKNFSTNGDTRSPKVAQAVSPISEHRSESTQAIIPNLHPVVKEVNHATLPFSALTTLNGLTQAAPANLAQSSTNTNFYSTNAIHAQNNDAALQALSFIHNLRNQASHSNVVNQATSYFRDPSVNSLTQAINLASVLRNQSNLNTNPLLFPRSGTTQTPTPYYFPLQRNGTTHIEELGPGDRITTTPSFLRDQSEIKVSQIASPDISSQISKAENSLENTNNETESSDNWDEMFQLLKKFHSENGHFQVSNKQGPNSEETLLHKWICQQRVEYFRFKEDLTTTMTPSRLQKFNDIGYVFQEKMIFYKWSERMDQLREYKAKYGNLNILRKYPSLGEFASRQRIEYQKFIEGKPSSMTLERMRDLQELGFRLQRQRPHSTRKSWEERFAELMEFKKKFGHTIVPQCSSQLGEWVHSQRKNYKLLKKGKIVGGLTADRVKKLSEVGFVFDLVAYRKANKKK